MLSGYLTAPQAAAILAVDDETIRRRLKAGVMAGEQLGARWFVLKSEVEKWKTVGKRKPGRKSRAERTASPNSASSA